MYFVQDVTGIMPYKNLLNCNKNFTKLMQNLKFFDVYAEDIFVRKQRDTSNEFKC